MPSPDDETLRHQMEHALESCQHFFAILGQSFAALIATDAILLGYAVIQRQGWGMEQKLLPGQDGIASVFLRTHLPDLYNHLVRIIEMSSQADRIGEWQKLNHHRLTRRPILGVILIGVAIATHLVLLGPALTVFDYKFM